MHRLDAHIDDIEPRITAIYQNTSSQEESSLQESLCSYGWILLDSWVAWRTLRFILRDADISENVGNKWFSTPSSYTASQIKAIWKFSDVDDDYLKNHTNFSIKEIFDGTIHKKRNSSAHFTKEDNISGQDSRTIELLYENLSKLFLTYECHYFFNKVATILIKEGYTDFLVEFGDTSEDSISNFKENIDKLDKNFEFSIRCKNQNTSGTYYIKITSGGCFAGIDNQDFKIVKNEDHECYKFDGNKAYYRDVNLFVESLKECWK